MMSRWCGNSRQQWSGVKAKNLVDWERPFFPSTSRIGFGIPWSLERTTEEEVSSLGRKTDGRLLTDRSSCKVTTRLQVYPDTSEREVKKNQSLNSHFKHFNSPKEAQKHRHGRSENTQSVGGPRMMISRVGKYLTNLFCSFLSPSICPHLYLFLLTPDLLFKESDSAEPLWRPSLSLITANTGWHSPLLLPECLP